MSTRKTANEVHLQLSVHEKMCAERWRSIYRKTDDLQASVNSTKAWLVGGLTTIVISLFTLIIRGMI
jgi:hypothetical protein